MTQRQDEFRAALLDGKAPVPHGLTDGHGQAAGRRFSVYRNNVALSLISALEASFPATAKTLGTEAFRLVATAYMHAHPPSTPMMMYYGSSFPAFLLDFPQTAHLGYLPDLARLEQAMRESYHAKDATPADLARLTTLSPEDMGAAHFGLAPAMRLVRSDWPVHAIWSYNMTEGAPKPPAGGQNVLITRPGFDPDMTVIDAAMLAFVDALATDHSLQEAVDIATALATDHSLQEAVDIATALAPEFDLSAALGPLLAGGAICDIKTGVSL